MAARDQNGRFLKGTVPNPTGRPREPEEVRELRGVVHSATKLAAMKMMLMEYGDIEEMAHNPNLTGAVKMLHTCYVKATVEGSAKHFELFFKVIGFNLNLPQQIDVQEIDSEGTGLEDVPTEKLVLIKGILEGD